MPDSRKDPSLQAETEDIPDIGGIQPPTPEAVPIVEIPKDQ
ncbi:MAG: hypothetical protein Q7K25_09885 [Actinomycetota bacterium]|nr:hypothetical protein [Actinomycetota bacterium]